LGSAFQHGGTIKPLLSQWTSALGLLSYVCSFASKICWIAIKPLGLSRWIG